MAAHQAPTSLGFPRQEHWRGLPFPPPMHESEKWKWSRPVVSDSSQPHGLRPTRLLHPWDFLGKSTGVGCHCLLWSIKHYKRQFLSKTKVPLQEKYTVVITKGVWEVIFPMFTLMDILIFFLTNDYYFLVFQFNKVRKLFKQNYVFH